MGNPSLHYPGDAPTPCWTCAHFLGVNTKPIGPIVSLTVTCAERGRFTHANPKAGCRHHAPRDDAEPAA